MRSNGRKAIVARIVNVKMGPELKQLIAKAADEEQVPMNEWMVRVVADYLGRPELAKIPRNKMGRPRAILA